MELCALLSVHRGQVGSSLYAPHKNNQDRERQARRHELQILRHGPPLRWLLDRLDRLVDKVTHKVLDEAQSEDDEAD